MPMDYMGFQHRCDGESEWYYQAIGKKKKQQQQERIVNHRFTIQRVYTISNLASHGLVKTKLLKL
jgi:hypothetical protein